MKRAFSSGVRPPAALIAAGGALIAGTYGLVRLAYGLYLPEMRADLLFDEAAAGAVSAGASIMYCLAALVGFVAAARAPRTLVLAAGVTAAAGAAGMAVASQFPLFACGAILGSAGAGLASPTLVAIIDGSVPAAARGRAQTIVNAGTGPGLVAAGALALILLPDWRTAWVVSAVVTPVAAILVVVFDRGDRARTRRQRVLPPSSWFVAHRRVIAAALLFGAGSAAVWNYGRTVLVDAGADEAVSIVAWIAIGAGGAFAILTARWRLSSRPRLMWSTTGVALGAATAAVAALPADSPPALAACLVFGWAYTAGTGALIGWTSEIDPARAATGTALLFVVLVLGQAGGAWMIGVLIGDAGAVAAFLVAAALALVAVLTAVARYRQALPTGSTPT